MHVTCIHSYLANMTSARKTAGVNSQAILCMGLTQQDRSECLVCIGSIQHPFWFVTETKMAGFRQQNLPWNIAALHVPANFHFKTAFWYTHGRSDRLYYPHHTPLQRGARSTFSPPMCALLAPWGMHWALTTRSLHVGQGCSTHDPKVSTQGPIELRWQHL
jgi:hypothetical protein